MDNFYALSHKRNNNLFILLIFQRLGIISHNRTPTNTIAFYSPICLLGIHFEFCLMLEYYEANKYFLRLNSNSTRADLPRWRDSRQDPNSPIFASYLDVPSSCETLLDVESNDRTFRTADKKLLFQDRGLLWLPAMNLLHGARLQ